MIVGKLCMGLIVVALCALFFAAHVQAAEVEATREEVIAEVEKATGCSKDALDAVMKESPQLFEKVGDTVTGIKVMNLIIEAKDAEAVAEVAKWQIGKQVDEMLKRVFPAPWLTAVSAFKAYYAALEMMRDYLVIPAFDERLYQAYKRQRSGAGGASPADAFTEATVLPASGYYVVKPSMLDKYIKARGWKKDVVGEKVLKDAEHRIDDFWQKRLEARYQKDLSATQAAAVKQTMWAAQAKNLAAIRAAAEKYGAGYAFFLTREDVDALDGWQFSQYTYWPPSGPDRFRPTKEKNNDDVFQGFHVIPNGYSEKKREDGFPVCYDSRGNRVHNAPYMHVSIKVCPRMMTGVYDGKSYTFDFLEGEKDLSSYDKHPFVAFVRELKEPGVVYGHLLRKASKNGSPGEKGYIVTFFTDKLRVTIGTSQVEPFGAPDTEDLIMQVMKIIVRKMGK